MISPKEPSQPLLLISRSETRRLRTAIFSSVVAMGLGMGPVSPAHSAPPESKTGVLVEDSPDNGPAWHGEETSPLGSLRDGLQAYLPMEGSIEAISGLGELRPTTFERNSAAFTEKLDRIGPHQPRFLPGRFGQAVFIEHAEVYNRTNEFPRTLSMVESLEGVQSTGEAKITRAEGPRESFGAVHLQAGPGGKIQTSPTTPAPGSSRSASVYIRGAAGTRVRFALEAVKDNLVLDEREIVLSGTWERIQCHHSPIGEEPAKGMSSSKKPSPPVLLSLTLPDGGEIFASAFMLESHGGYAGRRTASTWFPGQPMNRDGDILSLDEAPNASEGSVAFWFQREGDVEWRTLLCIGDHYAWNSDLRLDLRDNRTLSLVLPGKKGGQAKLPEAVQPGQWHHVAVTWNGPAVTVFFDGARVISLENAPPRPRLGQVTLGGMTANFSPALRGDVRLDEFALWSRPLEAAEINQLFHREQPLGVGLAPKWTLQNREPASVFARDEIERRWRFSVAPAKGEYGKATVRFSMGGFFQAETSLQSSQTSSGRTISFPWSPARLEPGTYDMVFELEDAHGKTRLTRKVEIVPARAPLANAFVIPWADSSGDLRKFGFTGGSSARTRVRPSLVDDLTRNGLYVQYRYNFTAVPEKNENRFLDAVGEWGKTDQASPSAQAQIDAAAARFGKVIEDYPQIRHIILNCESQFSWSHDFREGTKEQVRERFKLDLGAWQRPGGRSEAVTFPFGRLKTAEGKYGAPNDGILPEKDPFYAFHRWWHGPQAGNEVFLNDRLADRLRQSAPWVEFIGEPVLRRPSVRAFRKLDLVQEWFYFPSPSAAIRVQERARAVARHEDGSSALVGSMPQLLLKPGMAAPYPGLPTPDMFREAAWHCLARPTRGFTYWNHWSVIERPTGKQSSTQEEIDALMGPRPSWETAAGKISVKGERSDTFLFIPELREELARFHREDLHPLGALVPRWENRPRRIAIFRSFAAELFNNIRWPAATPLENAVERLQLPFDVLYDEDFETASGILEGYSVLAIPSAPVLPEIAVNAIRRFVDNGGTVVVDEAFGLNLPGVKQFNWTAGKAAEKELRKAETALRREYDGSDHNNFREGMEALASQFSSASGPTADAVTAMRAALRPEAEIVEGDAFPNLLHASGANYLAIVNTRRVPGVHYGHFGKVLENGVAQTISMAVAPELGSAVYDLLRNEQVILSPTENRSLLRIDLLPAKGRVLVFLPEEIGALESVPAMTKVNAGGSAVFEVKLSGQSGKALPGLIPAHVETRGPDENLRDETYYTVIENGKLTLEIPVAWNATPGRYSVQIREAASGKTVSVAFEVPPSQKR